MHTVHETSAHSCQGSTGEHLEPVRCYLNSIIPWRLKFALSETVLKSFHSCVIQTAFERSKGRWLSRFSVDVSLPAIWVASVGWKKMAESALGLESVESERERERERERESLPFLIFQEKTSWCTNSLFPQLNMFANGVISLLLCINVVVVVVVIVV